MASQFRLSSQMSSSPFGGFSTSTPLVPSQPHFRVLSSSSPKPQLFNQDAALLAPGTSEMAVVTQESRQLQNSGKPGVPQSQDTFSQPPSQIGVVSCDLLLSLIFMQTFTCISTTSWQVAPSQAVQLTQEQWDKINRSRQMALGRRASSQFVMTLSQKSGAGTLQNSSRASQIRTVSCDRRCHALEYT